MANNLDPVHWMKNAACKDENLRIFSSYDPANIEKAKKICQTCTVQKPCLAYYHELNCVSAGMSRYDRLVALWKRVENERQSNWRKPENVFPKMFK